MKKRFENRYQEGDLPWNINRPDFNLINAVNEFDIKHCKALDLGCGTGDNVFWAAKNGFDATGIDIAETAIEMAVAKAEKHKITAQFFVRDLFNEVIPGVPFGFVFDRGCFHTFDKKSERKLYAEKVHGLLLKNGIWVTLMGSVDDGRLDIGPPKRTAVDITTAVEPYFEILSVKQSRFDSNDEIPSKIWVGVFRKRV